MTTLQQDTAVMWECCNDRMGEPFDPCGLMTPNKQEALEDLKRQRIRRPDTYLVKHVLTRCSEAEERVNGSFH